MDYVRLESVCLVLVQAKVHSIQKRMFNIRVPCTNTFCKAMVQQPMTAKGIINIETN